MENLLSSNPNESNFEATASSSGFISDGVGGRVDVTTTGSVGSYLMGIMSLPNAGDVSLDRPTHVAFNYGGFEYSSGKADGIGSWAADMGLELYGNLGPGVNSYGWKPVIILKKKIRATTKENSGWDQYGTAFESGHNQVQFRNGYKPGTSPLIYWWYNYNGKVRMKIDGWAISPDMSGDRLEDKHLITILESSGNHNIPSISRWKILSTVVSADDTGKNMTNFKSLQLNGSPLTNAAINNPQRDHSYIDITSSNSVLIVVNRNIY